MDGNVIMSSSGLPMWWWIISSFPYFAGYIKPQAPYFLWLVLVNSPAFDGWLRCLPFDPPVGLRARLTRSLHRRLIAAEMSQRWAPWIACLQICRYVTTVWCKEKRENMIKIHYLYIVLFCTKLHFVILLHRTIVHYTMLYYTVL